MVLRSRDMVVSPEPFLEFIREELIPFIDATYRTDPTDRGLAGHPHGGSFVLYALSHSPETFSWYMAGSASCYHAIEAREFFEERSASPVRLYVSVGEREEGGAADVRRFAETLDNGNLEGLELTVNILEGATHFSSRPLHLIRGIYAVYSDAR